MVYITTLLGCIIWYTGRKCIYLLCTIMTRDKLINCPKLNQHRPQTLILIPNNPLGRPRRNNHIIPQPSHPKPSLTVHKIKQPLPPKRLDLDVACTGVFRAVILTDAALPVPHELVAPREERLAVVRACVLHGGYLEGAVCAGVDCVEEGGDRGEEAAGEDVAVDEGWDGGSCVVELFTLVTLLLDIGC